MRFYLLSSLYLIFFLISEIRGNVFHSSKKCSHSNYVYHSVVISFRGNLILILNDFKYLS